MISLEIGKLYKAPNYYLILTEYRLNRYSFASRRPSAAQNIVNDILWASSVSGGLGNYFVLSTEKDKSCKAWVIPCNKPFLVVGHINDHYQLLYEDKLGWVMLGRVGQFKNFVIKEVK